MDKHLIYATSSGTELGVVLFRDADFEVGKEDNSFLVTMLRSEYSPFPSKGRITHSAKPFMFLRRGLPQQIQFVFRIPSAIRVQVERQRGGFM